MTRLASNLAVRWAGVWIALVLMLSAVSNVAGSPDALRLVTEPEAAAAPLEIEFEARPGGSPARMETLKVAYLKLIELDITDRVRPYVTANRLLVKECNIPQGRHRVKISVADRDGNTTAEIIEMRVR